MEISWKADHKLPPGLKWGWSLLFQSYTRTVENNSVFVFLASKRLNSLCSTLTHTHSKFLILTFLSHPILSSSPLFFISWAFYFTKLRLPLPPRLSQHSGINFGCWTWSKFLPEPKFSLRNVHLCSEHSSAFQVILSTHLISDRRFL